MINRIIKFASLFLFLTLLFVTSKNIFADYLSYDESVQFWISNGISPDADLGVEVGNIEKVITNNRSYNLDPGGFSILLHYWTKISTVQIWLRLLPYLFWLGIIWGVYSILFSLTKHVTFSFIGGFLLMLFPVFANSGFEIRAFSMAGFGSVMGIKALLSIRNNKSWKLVLFWGIILAVFMTSRYSVIPLILILSLFILFELIKESAPVSSKFVMVLSFVLPSLVSFCVIYFLSMYDQNKLAEPLNYIPYLSKDFTLLFSGKSSFILIGLMFLSVLLLLQSRLEIQKEITTIWKFTLVYFLFVFLLSFLGIHPWQPFHLRGISLLLPLYISLALAFYSLFIRQAFVRLDIVMICLALLLSFSNRYKLQSKIGTSKNALNDLQVLPLLANEIVLIDMKESPHIKYQLMFGKLVNKRELLSKHLVFTKYKKHQFHGTHETLQEFYTKHYSWEMMSNFDYIISPVFDWMNKTEKWEKVPECGITWRKKKVN